jgi:nitric oxide dioxygenase
MPAQDARGRTLNPEQQEIVRASFAKIAEQPDMAAAMFYARVFITDPGMRSLFKIDMIEQGRKLMAMLAMVVDDLHRFEAIRPTIRELGRRHVGYGVKPADYDTLEAAMLWAFAKVLGDAFTPAVRDAWTACYRMLAAEMKDAASTI